MKNTKLWILVLLFLLGACKPSNDDSHYIDCNESLYRQAISQAMLPDLSKIYYDLVAINHQNADLVWKNIDGEEYLLVVAWKPKDNFYRPYLDSTFYNTGKFPIWVTTSPELLNRMKSDTVKDTRLRLKQLLGLPPNSVYNFFIEFWVKPQDLFRPCPDNEIDDVQCDLCFPDNADSTFKIWINENRISRYYTCKDDDYPWTQLGYTYDWNPWNESHIGLSEFVIDTNSKIKVKSIYTTTSYLNQNTNLE